MGESKREGLLHISRFHKDALVETANICSATASKALSDLTGLTVLIDVPTLFIVDREKLPAIIPSPEHTYVVSYSQVRGDLMGNLAFFLRKQAAMRVASQAIKKAKTNHLTKKHLEILKESGSIMFGHYLTGINLLLGTEEVIHKPPRIIGAFGDAILDLLSIDLGRMRHALVLKTNIYLSKRKKKTEDGRFVLVLNVDSVKELVKLIRGKVEA